MKGSRFRFNVVALVCVLGAGATGAETVMEKSVRLIGRRHFTAPENAVREGAAAPDPDPGLIVEGELYVLPDFSVKKRTVMEGRDLDTRMAKLRKGFARYPGLLRMPAQHKGLALYLLREDEDLRREGGIGVKS